MKLLVIGRRGQVAKSLASLDLRQEHQVVALGRPELDVTIPETVINALKDHDPCVVINASAYTAVDQAETERDQAFALNDLGAGTVAKACAHRKTPLIHLSTDYVFDGKKPSPYTEQDAVRPLGVYGESKCAGEQRVRALCPEHIIVRTAWVFSPFGKNFVKTMLKLAETRDEISVVNDQVGSPTDALHLAAALHDIARRVHQTDTAPIWGTFHAVGSGTASWFEVAQKTFAVSAALGGPVTKVIPIPSSGYPTAAKRPAHSRLHCEKLKHWFDITLPDWESGVEDCVRSLLVREGAEGRKRGR